MVYIMGLMGIALKNLFWVICSPLFLVVLILLYIQYRRLRKMEMKTLGYNTNSIRNKMIKSSIYGIGVSLIGTIVVILLGIGVNIKDFYFILPLALILLLINVRYLCFSYGGSIICIISFFTGFPKINISSVIALIGLLHLLESILIYLDGSNDYMPMVMENEKYELVGAFSMQRFWPIPFIILIGVSTRYNNSMSSWWPLLASKDYAYELAGAIAALGYGDMTCIYDPKVKSKIIAKRLFLYSISTIILSVISMKITIFKLIAPVFCITCHELLIRMSLKEEKEKTPLYIPGDEGVLVLEVMEKSPAHYMGLKRGDKIVAVNGYRVNNESDIRYSLNMNENECNIHILKDGRLLIRNYKKRVYRLGAFVISKDSRVVLQLSNNFSILKKIINKFKKRKHAV
ncbi:PDZ domain-containing protein [Anaeromicrobium sediminis]|uniref:PDZ domain-containing protein n=1 Tax=Anaeromicrobium sediminis TaxID=1478221 RepID=A0A267MEV5_9FIRM|nr:PDZ domain-containing protein [Anaeromicrobium sediminis]PAB58111.1 hypothetical protein CCE28_16685 [Anaeromicrobium sediminis]